MCFSSPSMPTPAAPQEAKPPDFTAMLSARKKAQTALGPTWLTGPSGVTRAVDQFAAPTLLGGALSGKTMLGG